MIQQVINNSEATAKQIAGAIIELECRIKQLQQQLDSVRRQGVKIAKDELIVGALDPKELRQIRNSIDEIEFKLSALQETRGELEQRLKMRIRDEARERLEQIAQEIAQGREEENLLNRERVALIAQIAAIDFRSHGTVATGDNFSGQLKQLFSDEYERILSERGFHGPAISTRRERLGQERQILSVLDPGAKTVEMLEAARAQA